MPQPELNVALDALEDGYGLNPPPEAVADAFSSWVSSHGKQMYPHQEDALLGIVTGDHLIVSTPTGSGKSMIAVQALFNALATGKTAYYTAPLKALVSEKFFDLITLFGAHNVGMVTGDCTINATAPIICATAEILANLSLRKGDEADSDVIVMDEFHYYSDPQRGWAWQVPLLEIPHAQQILLSATLGDVSFFVKDLERRTNRRVSVIDNAVRPVPLHFRYCTDPTAQLIQELVTTHLAPVYVVHFSRREAVEQAKRLLSANLISKEQKAAVSRVLEDFRFSAGFGRELSKLLRKGIGVHHAGLLPRYRRLVERMAAEGLLSVICGTDTLGVGINVPIRTVLITSLAKFDGAKMRHLTAREFHQIAGRAGRAGFDSVGYVIVQAPEYEIENARRIRKADGDPEKLQRVQKVKPEEGKLQWSEKTFAALRDRAPETMKSQMRITHSMILNLLQRRNPVQAAIRLLTDSHEPPKPRNPLIRSALEIYASLRRAEVIVHDSRDERAARPQRCPIRFAKEVPPDFALNTPLSPFALSALDLLDPDSPTYCTDILSVIEAVQEDPVPVLTAQRKALRAELIGRLKAEGADYEERMRLADEVTWPMPLEQLLTPALEIYAQSNPWVRSHRLSPKSVVRQMVEEALTFSEFISRYDLTGSEGIVLRYLTDTYRALRQIVPLNLRTKELTEIISWLGELIRSVDSSLLDEWEALAAGRTDYAGADSFSDDSSVHGTEKPFGADENGHVPFSRNPYRMRKAVRNAMFACMEAISRDDNEYLSGLDALGRTADEWEEITDAYFDEYDYLGTDTAARSEKYFQILQNPDAADLIRAGLPQERAFRLTETHAEGRIWLAVQTPDDGEDDRAWALWALVDLDASDAAGELYLRLLDFAQR